MLFNVVLDTSILCFLSLSQVFLQEPDRCSSNPCENGSTCASQQNMYTCACAQGWTGTHCEKRETGDAMHISRRSVSSASSYFCDSDWILDRTSCYFIGCICSFYVDECNSVGHNCSENAECENTEGGFTCSCKTGFSGDGADCTNIDECVSNPCENSATCHNSVNSYTCDCKDQFTGPHCEIDMCQPHFPAEADVIFLVDVFFSQSFIHLGKQKNFVKDFVSKFPIVSEEGPTYTGKGLQKIRESVLQSYNGARPDVNTYVFVLTDGLSSQLRDTKYQADKLKSSGVEVITVAVGRQMYHKEPTDIASHRTRVYPVSSDDALSVVYKAHVMDECPSITADVAIMVDASKELSVVRYYKQIDALVLLLKNMPVDVDDVHVNCSQYAQDVVDEIQLTDYMTSSDIVVKMNKLGQLISSSANVSRALEHLMKFSFLNSSGARGETRKIALLVTNADFNEETVKEMTDEADRLKDSGVILVIMTIGISDSLTTFLSMASDPAFTFVLGNDTNVGYDALFALLGSLDFDTCNID